MTIYDVGIIGGGPAGSTAASYLAQAGLNVAVIEGDHFPRPHVGESLIPAVTPVMNDIGFLETLDAAGFPKKYGAAWTSADSGPTDKMGFKGLSHDFRLAEITFKERDQPGVDRDYTYHVDRGRFDLLLLQHARSLGADVVQGAQVQQVDFADDKANIVCKIAGQPFELPVRVVIDASGRSTILGHQMGLKIKDPLFDQFAVHTWFEGLDRRALVGSENRADFIFIHFLPLTNTWMWQIPISDTVTSIGVVTQRQHFAKSKADREEFFWQCVASRSDLLEPLRNSKRIRPFTPEGDYSYGMKEICGDRFVLIGDAARFVDPIFSSGVSIALNSAKIACQDILASHKAGGSYAKEEFRRYETKMRHAVKNWYDFIRLYYRLNILFTAFVQDPRYRLGVLQLLQGDVYDGEPDTLQQMRKVVAAVEANPGHLWHKYLGEMCTHSDGFLAQVAGLNGNSHSNDSVVQSRQLETEAAL